MPRTPLHVTPRPAAQNGYAIRAFREKEGQSVQWLADAAGVTAPHLRNIENEHRNANNTHLSLIARALGVPVSALQRATSDVPVPAHSTGPRS